MNGYISLLSFRYMNLCVKAEAASLLPVTVTVNGQDMNIEGLADVAVPQEDMLAVVPHESAYLLQIGKGVMLAHPEFKMDIVQPEKSKNEEDKYLTFTMPEVDDARHDLLIDGVDTLHDQCIAKINLLLDVYTVKIAAKMVGEDLETIDAVKDKLTDMHDFYTDLCNKQADVKKKEIEDAYQKYLAEQEAKLQEKQEEVAAHSDEVAQRMKLDNLGEDEY